MYKFLSPLIFLLVLTNVGFAQDPQFTQIQSVPLFINPAFTGLNEGARYAMNYRRQYAGVSNAYASLGATADFNFSKSNSGLGASIFKEVAGLTRLSYTHGSLFFSHRLKVGKRKWINAGMKVGFVTRGFDLNSILLADQISRDNAAVTVESNLLERTSNFDFGFGLAYNNDRSWFGLSLDHLISPEMTLMEGGSAKMPVRLSVHGGGIVWSKGSYRAKEQVKIMGQYKKEAKWDQFDLGAYYHVERIYGGIFYRGIPFKQYRKGVPGHDAIAAIFGVKLENGMNIGYSYDFTISAMSNQSGGSHEISMVFTHSTKSRRRIKIPPCMEF